MFVVTSGRGCQPQRLMERSTWQSLCEVLPLGSGTEKTNEMHICHCVRGPQDKAYSHPWLGFITGKGCRARPAKGKVSAVKSAGIQAQESFPSGVPQDAPSFSSSELWCMWNGANQGSAPETGCPRFLLGAGHIATFCLEISDISGFQREVTAQHEPQGVQFRPSEVSYEVV